MSEYTERQMHLDMWRHFHFFRGLLDQRLNNIKRAMSMDVISPRQLWHEPYSELLELSRQAQRDTSQLERALDSAKECMGHLNRVADAEMSDLRLTLDKLDPRVYE